jgi:AcrR family transcriptional regulator
MVAEVHKVGRPRDDEDRVVYQALLDAAKACLDARGYHHIAIRDIALKAGTNAAMINYYFGSKGGLFVALIEQMFDDLHTQIGSLDKTTLSCHPQPSRWFVARLQVVYDCWSEVLRLFASEVVVLNTSLRQTFKQRIANTVYNDVLHFLEFMVAQNIYRNDIDLRSMALLLAGLVTVPYHFNPFLASATERPVKAMDAEQWQAALINILDNLLCTPKRNA